MSAINAGLAALKGAGDTLRTTSKGMVDSGGLAKLSQEIRDLENETALKVNTDARKGLLANQLVNTKADMQRDLDKYAEKEFGKVKKYAGALGIMKTISAGTLMMDEQRRLKNKQQILKAERDKILEFAKTINENEDVRAGKMLTEKQKVLDTLESEIEKTKSELNSVSTTTPTTATTSATSGKPISSAEMGAKGSYSVGQMKDLLVKHGMAPDKATTLAAIGMGESGGDPTTDTVKSGLDPTKKNEFSVGLWQINNKAHADKLARRGWNVEDLRNPDKAAQIAIEVYKEAGDSFTPWSVYTKNRYQQYLPQ